jgi:glycerophosphoryl diester phosphodiesterase
MHAVRRVARFALAYFAAVVLLHATPAAAQTYWSGVTRPIATTPIGNRMAVSCHNCYGDTNAQTTAQVQMALDRTFDLVEFDLTRHSDGNIYVEHANSGDNTRGTQSTALVNANLKGSNLMLFMEIKDAYDSANPDKIVLPVLRMIRDNGYATSGRIAFLRAFYDGRQQHLVRAKALVDTSSEFASIRGYVRFHTLVESNIRQNIRNTKGAGFDGVELNYTNTPNLFGAIMQAKLLGLGVGIYTIPATYGDLFLSAYREDLDFITTDYDRAATAKPYSVHALVQDATSLLYMNTGRQTAYPLTYKRTDTTTYSVPAGTPGAPTLEVLSVTSDEDRVGGSMVFNAAQYIKTYDADVPAGQGFLVTAVVNFDDLTSGSTAAIIAKSDSGGFALEQSGTLLRFGVYVNGAYTYATAPLSGVNGTNSYFIIGAYDGDGAVRLWVDNVQKTASAAITGGVGGNASPIVIGADPQGATSQRYFFSGKTQQVMVQRWHGH